MKMDLSTKEQIEIDWWKNSTFESPSSWTKENYLNKVIETKNFNYKVNKYLHLIKDKKHILEIGAGQGWASCFLKRYYAPQAKFSTTDISPFAIESIVNWEQIYNITIDKKYACKSYSIPEQDNSFDFIFCYAAAHHFIKTEDTLKELKRLLHPDGVIIFFYEPTVSRLLYPIYYKYVNTAPHSTPEDVLVPSEIRSICHKIKLNYKNNYDPTQMIYRSFITSMYFGFLRKLSFLKAIVPSSSDLIFTHKK